MGSNKWMVMVSTYVPLSEPRRCECFYESSVCKPSPNGLCGVCGPTKTLLLFPLENTTDTTDRTYIEWKKEITRTLLRRTGIRRLRSRGARIEVVARRKRTFILLRQFLLTIFLHFVCYSILLHQLEWTNKRTETGVPRTSLSRISRLPYTPAPTYVPTSDPRATPGATSPRDPSTPSPDSGFCDRFMNYKWILRWIHELRARTSRSSRRRRSLNTALRSVSARPRARSALRKVDSYCTW